MGKEVSLEVKWQDSKELYWHVRQKREKVPVLQMVHLTLRVRGKSLRKAAATPMAVGFGRHVCLATEDIPPLMPRQNNV